MMAGYNYRGPSLDAGASFLASAFMQAKEARRLRRLQELQANALQFESERQSLLPEARAAFAQGRPQMLQEIAPDEYATLAEAAKKRTDEAQQRAANVQRFVAMGIQSGRLTPEIGRELLQRNGIEPDLGPLGAPVPAHYAEQLQAAASARLGQPDAPALHTETAKELAARGILPGAPGYAGEYNAMRRQLVEEGVRAKKAGAQNINLGNDALGLPAAQQSKQAEKILNAESQLKMLDQIEADIEASGGHEALGNYWQRAGHFASDVMANAGVASPEAMDKLEKRGRAIASIGEMANAIISLRGGANVPPAEYARLVESLPHKNDSAPMRKAKIAAMRTNLEIIRDYGVSALMHGIKKGTVRLPNEPETGAGVSQSVQDERRAELDAALQAGSIDKATYELGLRKIGEE